MNRSLRFLSAGLLLVMLAACGAKGPLFLPEKPAVEPVVPADDATEGEAEPAPTAQDTPSARH
ncbi:sugar transporter [Pseudoxanthomonas kalamensis DSM 18571]|uniref:LPS translocon maturation chaperone LptM n=1 Tax=Pseudoxanthomonas kalamensis TaxID=289483 RepID=UPI0013920920|nr:lipoprotein [Pseudoxanthomonas kalamensis]KAF1712036.1 sugar transporter [Pseudoxanthomonas kalamensis DSM 18571]